LKNHDFVAHLITLMGTYQPGLTGNIWIFLHDPNTLYYPMSMNPCEGEATPKQDGRWEIRMGIGVEASEGDFEILLTIADAQTNQFIAETLVKQCENQKFDGFPVLPPGLTVVEQLKVTRKKVKNGPAPVIPDGGIAGQIVVEGFGEGGKVAQEEIISGTFSGIDESAKVWVLVYTFYGRWYPQSFNPCENEHTTQDQGQWKAKAIFGGEEDVGKAFDVVVVVADAEANALFEAKQREWCTAKHYPGLLTIQLPSGISVKYQTRVERK
jgi:hypothetical protein